MKLSENEQKQLVKLMSKIELPTTFPIFEMWCKVFGTVCAEVVVTRVGRSGTEILLIYRDDKYFKGWHIPGRLHLPMESLENTIKRVVRDEIKTKVSKPEFLGWFERPCGKGVGQSPRGHEFSFTFVVSEKKVLKENLNARFFQLNKLPKDLLKLQVPIIKALRKSK